MFRFTGPVGYNGVETEGFVYLQSGSAVSLNMCVLCVLSFSPCYFCTRLQHCYTSSTYTCLNPYSYTFYPLSWGKHSVISWTLPRLQIAEKLWEIRLSKKWGNRTVLLPRNEPPCTAGSAVQPGPTRMAVTHVLGFLVLDFMLENHPDEELHQIKIKIKT